MSALANSVRCLRPAQLLGLLAGLAFAWSSPSHAGDQRYQAGAEKVVEIALELRDVLEPKWQAVIQKPPLTLVENARPSLRLVEEQGAGGAGKAATLVMSTGFLELMNRAAHATAIDELEKGYLRQYLLSWPAGEAPAVLPGLPRIDNPKYWSEEVMDRQMTCFAQLVGLAMGIEYANYYLGHFAKHADRLQDAPGPAATLNQLLSAKEWDATIAAAARSSLDCAYGMGSVTALLQCVDAIETRPDWMLHFAPDPKLLKTSKYKYKLVLIEREFFK